MTRKFANSTRCSSFHALLDYVTDWSCESSVSCGYAEVNFNGDRDEPLHERIKWAHESGLKIFENNLSCGTILVMPTQKLLWGLDPEREKTEQELFVEMIPILERYSQLMPHPKGECDSWDIRTILHTMESVVTLQL